MADLISTSDLTARLGRTLTGTEAEQAAAFITDASALVVSIVDDSTVTDSWDESDGTPAAVVPVVVNMVRRALDNPHGLTMEQNSGYLYQVDKARSTGIFATRDEAKVIRRAADKSPVGALTLEGYLPRSYRDPGLSLLDESL